MKKSIEENEPSAAGDFRLDEFLPYRLSVAAETVALFIAKRYLGAAGLAMPEWRLLAAVGCNDVLSPTAAGELTSMDKVRISRTAASLIARGLLKQTLNPADGRGRHLRLTRKGVAAYLTIPATARAVEADLARGLTKMEWSVLHKALGKIGDHAKLSLAADPALHG